MINHYVLSGFIHVPDNWYGSNYRIIFRPKEELGFRTKRELIVYRKAFRAYCKNYFRSSSTFAGHEKIQFLISKVEHLKEYEYCSSGPSFSCKHIYITPEDLNGTIR